MRERLPAALMAACLIAGCDSERTPTSHRPPSAAGPEQTPFVDIEILPAAEAGKSRGLVIRVSPEQTKRLAEFVPISYEVPELDMRVPLPVQDGLSEATTTFPQSQALDGKTFLVYGIDPAMGTPRLLTRFTFGEPQPRK